MRSDAFNHLYVRSVNICTAICFLIVASCINFVARNHSTVKINMSTTQNNYQALPKFIIYNSGSPLFGVSIGVYLERFLLNKSDAEANFTVKYCLTFDFNLNDC